MFLFSHQPDIPDSLKKEMIKKASTLIVEFWIKNAIIKTDDKESYCYGMELILSTLINVAFMVILSYYVIGYPIAFIPYIAVYTPLRLTAGGYHARSHLKCILYTQITFIVFVMSTLALAKKYMVFDSAIYGGSVNCTEISSVEAENKPLTGEEKHKQQLNTWGFQTIILILIVIAAILEY